MVTSVSTGMLPRPFKWGKRRICFKNGSVTTEYSRTLNEIALSALIKNIFLGETVRVNFLVRVNFYDLGLVMLMCYIRKTTTTNKNRLDFFIIKTVFALRGIKKRDKNLQNLSEYADHMCIAFIRIYKEHSQCNERQLSYKWAQIQPDILQRWPCGQ